MHYSWLPMDLRSLFRLLRWKSSTTCYFPGNKGLNPSWKMCILALAFVAFSILVLPSTTAPVGDVQQTVGWVSDPNGRGTSGLILSCLLTLGLCVWSAMHLNIPQKHESTLQYWLRNAKWIFLGILIPELVVLSAWRQWLSAKNMSHQMGKILKRGSSEENGGERAASEVSVPYLVTRSSMLTPIDKDSAVSQHCGDQKT